MSLSRSKWLVVVLLIAAGCSSDSTTASKKTSRPSPTANVCVGKKVPIAFPCPITEFGMTDVTAQGDQVTLDVKLGDQSFDLTYVKAKPGAKFTINFIGTGSFFRHVFAVDSLKIYEELPAEKNTTVSFTLPSSGPVLFWCPPHQAVGMRGAFYFA